MMPGVIQGNYIEIMLHWKGKLGSSHSTLWISLPNDPTVIENKCHNRHPILTFNSERGTDIVDKNNNHALCPS